MRMPRFYAAVMAFACAGAGLAAITAEAGPASAATLQIVCNGTAHTTYSPPLTNTPQTTTVSGQDTGGNAPGTLNPPCVNAANPGLTYFVATFSSSVPDLSCALTQPLTGSFGTEVFTWNDGSKSTWQWTTALVQTNEQGQLVGTFTGPVTKGRYQGGFITEVSIEVAGGLCLSGGVSQENGDIVWTWQVPGSSSAS